MIFLINGKWKYQKPRGHEAINKSRAFGEVKA